MDVVLQFLYRVQIWFVCRTFQVLPEKISLGTLEKYGIRIKSAHHTGSEGQHQPRSCSHQNHCYIGYTSTRWQHDCWLTVQTLYAIYSDTSANEDNSFRNHSLAETWFPTNPVGLVGLPYVMWSAHFFVTHIQTEKISCWNGPTVLVCCFMLARASTKTFVSRVRKTAKKIFVSRKIRYQGHSFAEVSLYV